MKDNFGLSSIEEIRKRTILSIFYPFYIKERVSTPYIFGLKDWTHNESISLALLLLFFQRIMIYRYLRRCNVDIFDEPAISFLFLVLSRGRRELQKYFSPAFPVYHIFPLSWQRIDKTVGFYWLWLLRDSPLLAGSIMRKWAVTCLVSYGHVQTCRTFWLVVFQIWKMTQSCFQTNQACVYHGSRVQIYYYYRFFCGKRFTTSQRFKGKYWVYLLR